MSTVLPEAVRRSGVHRERVLDVRPVLQSGGDSFALIMRRTGELADDEALHLIVGFEPAPLYTVMRGRGRAAHTEHAEDAYHVWFYRDAATEPERPSGGDQASSVEQAARDALFEVHDPETDLNLIDLGLIYRLTYRPEARRLEVLMTLTTPACPAGGTIIDGVQRRLSLLPRVDDVAVELTFDPHWMPERISPDGRAFLGW